MHGFNDLPINLFRDSAFQAGVVSNVIFDWMHVFMTGGCFNTEVWVLMNSSGGAQAFTQCGEFICQLVVPRRLPQVRHLFSPKQYSSCRDAEQFKASASEGLTLYPMFRKWCNSVLIPRGYTAPAESFIALTDVLDLLSCSRNGIDVSPEQLSAAMLNWLQKHTHAYGDDFKKPKSHYALHLSDMLRHRKFLCACWVHERHHKVIKRYGIAHHNLKSMENGLCEEVIVQKVSELRKDIVVTGVLDPRHPSARIASDLRAQFGLPTDDDVVVGSRARVSKRHLCTRDVALAEVNGAITAGMIEQFFHTATLGCRVVFVPWSRLDSDGITARYQLDKHSALAVPLEQMLDAVIHSAAGRVRHVLVPAQWRHLHET